jgi:hypothetical protein
LIGQTIVRGITEGAIDVENEVIPSILTLSSLIF